jgi:hypothetical protein
MGENRERVTAHMAAQANHDAKRLGAQDASARRRR